MTRSITLTRGISALVVFAALLIVFSADSAFAQDAGLGQRFAQGVQAYKEGKYEEAEAAFNDVLAKHPDSKTTAELREIAGMKILMEMYMRRGDDKITAMAKYLVQQWDDQGYVPTLPSDEDIKAMVEKAVTSKEFQVRFKAKIDLGDQAREHAVPYLQRFLEENSSNAVNAIDVAVHLAGDALWPLLEMLKSDKVQLRRNCVLALGRMGDDRAIADLKFINEQDKDTVVRDLARVALIQITNSVSWQGKTAAQLYYDRGMSQFLAYSALVPSADRKWWVWRWDASTGKLRKRTVRWFQYNEYLAEESAYRATQANSSFEEGWDLLVAVNLQMYREFIAIRDSTKDAGERDSLEETIKEVHNKLVMAGPAGQFSVYGALGLALENKKSEVCLGALDVLGEIATADSLPPVTGLTGKVSDSIIRALDYEDKRVRYAAARALCKISPNDPFYGMHRVMTRLSEALGEYGAEAVLIISENPDVNNQLITELKKRHYTAFYAATAKEGLWRVRGFPNEDVIICDYQLLLKPVVSAEFGSNRFTPRERVAAETLHRSLLQDYRTKKIPILVICSADEETAARANLPEGKNNIAGFIIKRDQYDFDLIDNQIKKALTDSTPGGAINRGVQEAVWAARTLGALDPDATIFDVDAAMKALVANATQAAKEGRNGDIVVASMRALGRLARRIEDLSSLQRDIMPGLHDTLENREKTTDRVRGAVAFALGEIYKTHQRDAYRKDTYIALLENLKTMKDPAARREVGLCLGKLPLTADERRNIYKVNRDHGFKK